MQCITSRVTIFRTLCVNANHHIQKGILTQRPVIIPSYEISLEHLVSKSNGIPQRPLCTSSISFQDKDGLNQGIYLVIGCAYIVKIYFWVDPNFSGHNSHFIYIKKIFMLIMTPTNQYRQDINRGEKAC